MLHNYAKYAGVLVLVLLVAAVLLAAYVLQ